MDSIAWAEKQVGSKLPEPPRELDRLRDEEKNLFKVEDYDGTEDADIAQTLRSAHQAEVALGYHQIHSNSPPVYNRFNYTNYGNDTNNKTGNYSSYLNDSRNYYNDPHAYNPYHYYDYSADVPSEFNGTAEFHNDPEYYTKGFHTANSEFDFKGKYANTYGKFNASIDPEKQAWWNHLIKVPYDGMAPATLFTKGTVPTWGNSQDYEKQAMEKINEQQRAYGAWWASHNKKPEDEEIVKELDSSQDQTEAKEAEKSAEENKPEPKKAPNSGFGF